MFREIFHSHRWVTVWEFSIAHPIFHSPWATGRVGVFIPAVEIESSDVLEEGFIEVHANDAICLLFSMYD